MLKRRPTALLVVLRRLLTCAIGAIALLALLSVDVHVFPSSKARRNPEPNQLSGQHDLSQYQRAGTEQSWKQELVPPHFSKPPSSSAKLDSARQSLHLEKLWKPPPNRNFVPCINPSVNYTAPDNSRGYLLVHTNGGLNQMRAGICDMVAVARIINATLVIPELDKMSFWQDSSNFSDVFDEDHFIKALGSDIEIIKKLPKELDSATKAVKQFRSWSGMEYYQQEIADMWKDYDVIRAAKSDSRLANNNLPQDIQRLRCRACYQALRFAPQIEAMGKLLVARMRSYGPYISLHLRYEKDMLAFSGCTHGLSATEADELKTIRENTEYWKVKEIDSAEQRSKGFCPLTPKEVGIFLTALGYPSSTPIYIAAGEIYGGDTHMSDLRYRYPILMSKEKLASVEELKPFMNHSSQMAALDYIVSIESDVFIPSYSGNMARAVEGHRRFLGHRKTISPDRKTLVRLFDKIEQGTLKEGKRLSERIIELHKRRQGSPRRRKGPITGTKGTDRFRSEEVFYENPLPDCLCQRQGLPTEISHKISHQQREEILDSTMGVSFLATLPTPLPRSSLPSRSNAAVSTARCSSNAGVIRCKAKAEEDSSGSSNGIGRRDVIKLAGATLSFELLSSSGSSVQNASAADLIQRRQRSEFLSSIKGTLAVAFEANPDLIPSVLTLSLNDAITYDKATKTGGPNGSIRFSSEISRPENKGLDAALRLLEEAKKEIDSNSKGGPISYADLIHFGAQSALKATFLDSAIKKCGGNKEKGRLLYTAYGSTGQWGLFDRQFGRSDSEDVDPEGRVPLWTNATVQEMKDKFAAIGFGPRQLAVMSAFLSPDQAATETLLASDKDVKPWVEKYQRSRETVSRTDYEVDLITTLTKLCSLGQTINYEAYTYPVKRVDLTKLKL